MNMQVRYGDSKVLEPLHYNWSGLDDVYLLSGYERIPTDDGEDFVIQDLDGLHRAIGMCLAEHKKVLTGKDVRFLRKQMDVTQSEMGRLMATSDQTVARWEKGEFMPGPAEALLRIFYLAHINQTVDARKFIEELRERDSTTVERMEFTETAEGWKAAA